MNIRYGLFKGLIIDDSSSRNIKSTFIQIKRGRWRNCHWPPEFKKSFARNQGGRVFPHFCPKMDKSFPSIRPSLFRSAFCFNVGI